MLWSAPSDRRMQLLERQLLDAIASGELDNHLVAIADALSAQFAGRPPVRRLFTLLLEKLESPRRAQPVCRSIRRTSTAPEPSAYRVNDVVQLEHVDLARIKTSEALANSL